ncbi:class I SAM-dependent methyltransferase [Phytoactinopolyspora mesophila]|uniref:Methyltransferase domain-containing protein n=1 Tax=Phytoactinopolyspora mesophila TaxID=2650750 RepID=A0A7K3M3M2_9ACTN|nr:class I SAM-dependent methyltransferase [Phytoactinopolyspora mesophila]NDL57512.1 methyltransferase domain-containing protein [Phytoactinopolyspora mesophila]
MDVEALRTLASPAGATLLTEASRWHGIEDEFALGTRLRRAHEPELVAAALTQAELRRRAGAKFEQADVARMYFTINGYEQATRSSVARHRAARIAAAGRNGPVLDLCCGIGGDMMALARAGLDVTGVESDELTAEVARLNIAALGLSGRARVLTADATTTDRRGYTAVTCDPARRTSRGRVFDTAAYQPPWPFVLELLRETACVKVAPGIPHDKIPPGTEAEWVSDNGEVKEAALWSQPLAGAARRATLLRYVPSADDGVDSDAVLQSNTLTEADDPGDTDVRAPGRYIYEPDGAVIRAGLVTAAAAEVDGWLVDPSIAYVSSDTYVPTPFARGYEVTEVLPYDMKLLRGYVRDNRIGTLTIKKRGVGVVPEQLRQTLRPRGGRSTTLIITRVRGKATVLVTTPQR